MNWGFVAYGRIAAKFMEGVKLASGETALALASRSNAVQLQQAHPDKSIYDNYTDLLGDEEVDVVYISTTHNFHKDNVLEALAAGKHVLCEKPMGLTVAEIEEVTQAARAAGRFLMEGLWSRFLPGYQKVIELARSGRIGEVKAIRSEFAFHDVSHKERLYDPKLAGGSNYDVNIYNLALVHDLFGAHPEEMQVQARKSETGTDLSVSSILEFSEGRLAQLFSSIEMTGQNEAWIYGTTGKIGMKNHWMCERFEVVGYDGTSEQFDLPFEGNGFVHEVREVAAQISAGKLESALMSLQHSLELTSLLERTENLIQKG